MGELGISEGLREVHTNALWSLIDTQEQIFYTASLNKGSFFTFLTDKPSRPQIEGPSGRG